MAAPARRKPKLPRADSGSPAALFAEPAAAAAHCWQLLVRGSRDRRAAWRTPVLSTIGLDGAPRARVLVLRKVEPAASLLWLHTDVRSAKRAELAADARAALTFWDSRRALQLRVEGVARIELDPALLSDAWARVPEASRRNYATIDRPGTPSAGPVDHGDDGRANFAMIAIRPERMEWLWLGPDRHWRGESRRLGDSWESGLLVP